MDTMYCTAGLYILTTAVNDMSRATESEVNKGRVLSVNLGDWLAGMHVVRRQEQRFHGELMASVSDEVG